MAVFVASTAGRSPAGLLLAPSIRRETIDLDTYELFRRGSELLAAGHAHQAVISLEQARDAAPGHGSVREALGRAYFRSRRFEQAADGWLGQGTLNAATGFVCPLGTDTDDPLERLRTVSASTRRGKSDMESLSANAAEYYTLLGLVPLLLAQRTGVLQKLPPLFNFTVSNVVLSKEPLYLLGAELDLIVPVSFLGTRMPGGIGAPATCSCTRSTSHSASNLPERWCVSSRLKRARKRAP